MFTYQKKKKKKKEFWGEVSFFFWISKNKILLMKDKQEKYKEFTVVNKGYKSSP